MVLVQAPAKPEVEKLEIKEDERFSPDSPLVIMKQETVADQLMPASKVPDRYLASARKVKNTPYKQLPENDDALTVEIRAEEDRQHHSVDVVAEEVVVPQIAVSTVDEVI